MLFIILLFLSLNRPKLNEKIFFEVRSTDLLEHITYQIVSCGKLIYSNSLNVSERNYHVFNVFVTFDMVPRADLIVYYFKNDDIISSKMSIDIRDDLSNIVKLKLSQTQVKPGDTVDIDIVSNPNSYIGLLAVDQSVLLLKKTIDIGIDDVWNERELYQYHFHEKKLKSKPSPPYFYNRYWNDFKV